VLKQPTIRNWDFVPTDVSFVPSRKRYSILDKLPYLYLSALAKNFRGTIYWKTPHRSVVSGGACALRLAHVSPDGPSPSYVLTSASR
jgi:hypothetical protein